MTSKPDFTAETENEDAAPAVPTPGNGENDSDSQAQDTTGEMDPLALAEAEIDLLNDKLLRALAEQQNLRRRADREKSEATLYAATNFARDLLSVSDNLARALESVSDDARALAGQSFKNLLEGIELTQRELQNAFEKHNIKKIDPMGEKFDPNMHQAMFEVPDNSVEKGTVVQVVQPGYKIGERVLRPAMVGVAKPE